MRAAVLRAEFVDSVPRSLDPGVLYVCERYGTAAHLCACGCGLKVATSLREGKWTLLVNERGVSLHPSIGNWSFPCRSHYWVRNNRIEWSYEMTPDEIRDVRSGRVPPRAQSFRQQLRKLFHNLLGS